MFAMHAWESIQKAVDHIEENLGNDIQIEALADIASLSLFYFQRLFTRLVKKPIREYIKLRRLACACERLACKSLENEENRILDIALDYGFNSHETFTKAFKAAYGITPSEYRDKPVGLENFAKPNLLLNYVMVDEGVPLITEGIVLEYNREILASPVYFLGVKGLYHFKLGKMVGEKTGVSGTAIVWEIFFSLIDDIPRIQKGRMAGVSCPDVAPDGFATYFAGAEVEKENFESSASNLIKWEMSAREYIVCKYEAESLDELMKSIGKMMKFTRFWLKKHGLVADRKDYFPEIYYPHLSRNDYAYMEMWIPVKERENNKYMEELK